MRSNKRALKGRPLFHGWFLDASSGIPWASNASGSQAIDQKFRINLGLSFLAPSGHRSCALNTHNRTLI